MGHPRNMTAATYEDVRRAIDEGRLRAGVEGLVEGRLPYPKATWRPKALELVSRQGATPYHRVTFTMSAGRVRCLVHRVVWFAHRGAIPGGLTVNHRNGRKVDNRLANLELMTHAEQQEHAVASGLHDPYRPKNWSLTAEAVREIRRRVADGETQKAVAADHGTNENTVSRIVRRLSYRSVL